MPAASSVVLRIATASLDTGSADRDAHLRSPDFLDVERYPEMVFVSTRVQQVDDDVYRVTGDLTIKDKTHRLESTGTVTGPAVTLGDITKVGIALETVVDRTQYGLTWNAPLPKGGVALANDVKLTVELELAREEA